MEDAKIIDLYFARSEDAICQTDAVYGKRLFSIADRILHDPQDAEESVSDTYPAAFIFLRIPGKAVQILRSGETGLEERSQTKGRRGFLDR